MSGNNIKVVCRFRPQNKLEIREGGVPIIDIDEDGTQVTLKGEATSNFAFDKVFGMNTPQKDVFEYSIKSIVDDVTAGYNGTVFAYGQTGSGKTFTMMGADIDDPDTKGIIPRIIEQIFSSINDAPTNIEFTVKVSYMEIYMERVRDLFNPSNDNLAIHEDKTRGVYVKDLYEIYVANRDEVYLAMKNGSSNRVVAYTNMNAESSRSHSIVVITITQKNLDTGAAKSGKLYLVDLAGSEKVGKTGASGQTLEEAKKINKSLTALGMVINSLTDGKSSHVPYRDSKLTRILQESLGGNSRTTLIINCSPSSYNEAETISTLRFGMRAKSIKNKAKVNADLSPAELKALLKKAKTETVTFQTYIAALEGEVNIWRGGNTLPSDKWVSLDKINKGDFSALPPASNFKSSAVVDDSSRPVTPSVVLEKDEREELLKRENELMDQIAEKETELAKREKLLESLKEEMDYYKEQESIATKENQQMANELSELKLKLHEISCESRENAVNVESLKEANQELLNELEELRKNLQEVRLAYKDNADTEKEKKKAAKISQMMNKLDPSVTTSEINQKERQIRESVTKIEIDGSTSLTMDEVDSLHRDLADSQILLEQHVKTVDNLQEEKQVLEQKKLELHDRLKKLEQDYEELLDKTIAEEEATAQKNADIEKTISTVKVELETQYTSKKEMQQQEIEELRKEISAKEDNISKLSDAMSSLKAANDDLQNALNEQPASQKSPSTEREQEVDRMRKTMKKDLADFETMKKALMRDLQLRCEKVVELEMSLDETREQYNNVLKASNNKTQQQKMAMLERNLEQLRNLVDQNSSLKKEVSVAERKLSARNERIQSLEALLQDAQEKLIKQNQKFEEQLKIARERLEQALYQKSQSIMPVNFGRVAKPLRGGGAAPADYQENVPASPAEKNKRTSWISGFMGSR
ncbi:hypothetical protein G6F57_004691 [Rhizopus arrhizus]|uniref:Kinesin-like protein n=1 Tax=Rhizopus oryzae TaxID=64495 RepID=A0A9P6XKM1_RHIOR|nr:hypothetical protein G6F23_000735 [Rhizopus arrhizus]KAG1429240.1 hypothetical protein G6F58_000138 [Rhizopus delemar]KAG0767140.1 hypothetical protein G6F24_003040 [Rhizopus arrhizus]KAG0792297.1 hypothetical protein G6F21_004457 [Rhizopus arrhizus]KAG0802398.1 hypothetical protein G6F22_000301 [Rhizopus arrhizus]